MKITKNQLKQIIMEELGAPETPDAPNLRATVHGDTSTHAERNQYGAEIIGRITDAVDELQEWRGYPYTIRKLRAMVEQLFEDHINMVDSETSTMVKRENQ
jgi:hypothetical protein